VLGPSIRNDGAVNRGDGDSMEQGTVKGNQRYADVWDDRERPEPYFACSRRGTRGGAGERDTGGHASKVENIMRIMSF